MSLHRTLKTATADIEEPRRDGDVVNHPDQIGRWPLGEPLPALLTDADMRRVFGISERSFLRWKRMGRFAEFEVSAQAGVRRYSGLLVERYLRGERPSHAVTFGRRRA